MTSYHDIEHMIIEIRNRPINKVRKNDAWEEICIALKGDHFNEASEELIKKKKS